MNPHQKIAVITGAGSGIGRALALQLSRECRGLALCDINPEKLAETVLEAEKSGCKVYNQVLDVSDREGMEGFAAAVIKHFGEVDIVINNAGVALGRASVLEVPIEGLEWIIGINLWGMIYGSKAFLPHLITRPEASLVNVSSLFGMMAVPQQSGYITSKFAIRGFNETLGMELRHTHPHVRLMSVQPGGVSTNIARDSKKVSGDDERFHKAMIQNFDKMLRMPPEKAASRIVRGIRKKKRRLLVGWDAWLMDKVVRISPVGYQRLVSKRVYKQQEEVRRKLGGD
jgi:butyryl-CoA dehydrogenase